VTQRGKGEDNSGKEAVRFDMDKFVKDVKMAFGNCHKDIQNLNAAMDKLNKKFDIVGEEVEILRKRIESGEEGGSEDEDSDENDSQERGESENSNTEDEGFYPKGR